MGASEHKDMKSSAISALFWRFFEQGGTAVVTLVVQVVMARQLSPEEFGALAIMLVFVNVGNVIVQSGLNTAIIQNPDTTDDDCSTVFWMSLTVSLLIYAGVFMAAPAIAAFYNMPRIIAPLRLLEAVLMVNAYNSVQEAIVARNLQFHKTARATVVAGAVSGTVGVIMAMTGFGIWSLAVQQLLQQLVKCIVLAAQVPWKPRLVFLPKRAKILFCFGWKLLVSGVMDQGYQSLTDLIVGKVFTDRDLGFVSQGKKYPFYLGAMLDGVIQPVMLSTAAQVQSDVARVKRLVRRALKTSTFLIFPAMAAFAVAANPIVRIVFGDKWLPSVPFLQMYCLIYMMLPVDTTNLQALNGMGRSDLFLRLEIIKKAVGIATICLTALVIQDIYAIVIGQVISNFVCVFINAHPNKRVIGYGYLEQARDVMPAFVLSAVAAVAAWPVSMLGWTPFPTAAAQVAIMVIVYIGCAWLFRVEEFSYLLNTAREIIIRRSASGSDR